MAASPAAEIAEVGDVREMMAQFATMSKALGALGERLDRADKLGGGASAKAEGAGSTSIVGNANTVSYVNNVNNMYNVVIDPPVRRWGTEEGRLLITPEMFIAAFERGTRLSEFSQTDYRDQSDPDKAAPYVVDSLVELVKRAHADSAAQNIHLNPNRADQVKVLGEVGWKILTLAEATRALFDEVEEEIGLVTRIDALLVALGAVVGESISNVRNVYNLDPGAFVDRARKQMAAHLANLTPAPDAPPPGAAQPAQLSATEQAHLARRVRSRALMAAAIEVAAAKRAEAAEVAKIKADAECQHKAERQAER